MINRHYGLGLLLLFGLSSLLLMQCSNRSVVGATCQDNTQCVQGSSCVSGKCVLNGEGGSSSEQTNHSGEKSKKEVVIVQEKIVQDESSSQNDAGSINEQMNDFHDQGQVQDLISNKETLVDKNPSCPVSCQNDAACLPKIPSYIRAVLTPTGGYLRPFWAKRTPLYPML